MNPNPRWNQDPNNCSGRIYNKLKQWTKSFKESQDPLVGNLRNPSRTLEENHSRTQEIERRIQGWLIPCFNFHGETFSFKENGRTLKVSSKEEPKLKDEILFNVQSCVSFSPLRGINTRHNLAQLIQSQMWLKIT